MNCISFDFMKDIEHSNFTLYLFIFPFLIITLIILVFSFCVSTHKFFKITFEEFWTLIGLWIMITLPFTITFYSDYNEEERMMSNYHNKTYDSLEVFVKEIV
jgi:hypothetical protein